MKLDSSKVIRLRAKKRWTQKVAAKKSGVSLPTFMSAEHGNDIQPIKAEMIASAFRVELEELEAKELQSA